MKDSCEYAREWKQEGKRSILDVNCGTGEDAICFVNAGFWVTAADPQEKHVSHLRQWEKENGKILRSKQCGIVPLPFAENAFDCVWAKFLFMQESGSSFEEVLREIRRVLKPDGFLAVWIPAFIFGKAKVYKGEDEENLNEKMYDFVFQESIWSEEGVWITAVLQKEEKKPDYTKVLGRKVRGKIDRPLGSWHSVYKNLYYPVNYGYVEGILAGDGEEQDVYVLGEEKPLSEFEGTVVGVVHRLNDVEDKWVVDLSGKLYSEEEIWEKLKFQEQYFDSEIYVLKNDIELDKNDIELDRKGKAFL